MSKLTDLLESRKKTSSDGLEDPNNLLKPSNGSKLADLLKKREDAKKKDKESKKELKEYTNKLTPEKLKEEQVKASKATLESKDIPDYVKNYATNKGTIENKKSELLKSAPKKLKPLSDTYKFPGQKEITDTKKTIDPNTLLKPYVDPMIEIRQIQASKNTLKSNDIPDYVKNYTTNKGLPAKPIDPLADLMAANDRTKMHTEQEKNDAKKRVEAKKRSIELGYSKLPTASEIQKNLLKKSEQNRINKIVSDGKELGKQTANAPLPVAAAIKGAALMGQDIMGLNRYFGMDNQTNSDSIAQINAFVEEYTKEANRKGVAWLADEVISNVIRMSPSIAIAIATGGAAAVPSTVAGIQSAGGYFLQAESEGANPIQSRIYGAIGGTIEGSLQRILGPFGKILPSGFKEGIKITGKETIKSIMAKSIVNLGKTGAKEGLEEGLTDPLTGLAKKAIYDPKHNLMEDIRSIPYSALVGAFSAGAMSSPAAIVSMPSIIENVTQMKSYIEEVFPGAMVIAQNLPKNSKSYKMSESLTNNDNVTYTNVLKLEAQVRQDLITYADQFPLIDKTSMNAEQNLINDQMPISQQLDSIKSNVPVQEQTTQNVLPQEQVAQNVPQEVMNEQATKTPEETLLMANNAIIGLIEGAANKNNESGTPVKFDEGTQTVEFSNKVTPKIKAATTIAEKLGLKINIIKPTEEIFDQFNGLIVDDQIFINEKVDNPHVFVLGHEIMHDIQSQQPELYVDFLKTFSENINVEKSEEYKKKLQTLYESNGIKVDNPTYLSEFSANFLGENFTKTEFWDLLGETNPSLGRTIVNTIKKVIAKLKTILNPSAQVSQYINNLETVQRKAAEILSKYYEAKNPEARTMSQNQESIQPIQAPIQEQTVQQPQVQEQTIQAPILEQPAVQEPIVQDTIIEKPIKKQTTKKTVKSEKLVSNKKTKVKDNKTIKMKDRLLSNVGDRKVNSYQFDNPDVKDYIQSIANYIHNNEFSQPTGKGYIANKMAIISPVMRQLKETGVSYNEIKKALQDITNDEGSENYAIAKKVEIVLDDILTNGFEDAAGTYIASDVDYIALKNKIDGTKIKGKSNEEVELPIDEYKMSKPYTKLKSEKPKSTKYNLKADKETVEPFYSKLQRTLEQKMPNKSDSTSVRNMIKSNGIKEDEIKWSGIEDYLSSKTSVLKQELLDYLKANEIKVEEITKGLPMKDSDMISFNNLLKEADYLGFDNIRDAKNAIKKDENWSKSFDVSDLPELIKLGEQYRISFIEQKISKTKFEQYVIPGGENYRELLFTMPAKKRTITYEEWSKNARSWGKEPGTIDEYNKLVKDGSLKKEIGDKYQSGHWNESNVLAHVRFNGRTDVDGNKVLFVEEIQSDWHQEGRKKGYKGFQSDVLQEAVKNGADESKTRNAINQINKHPTMLDVSDGNDPTAKAFEYLDKYIKNIDLNEAFYDRTKSGVPDAPFAKTWHEFAIKRLLRYATENGYDKIAFTTGEQQADRYDLSKQIETIKVTPWIGDTGMKLYDTYIKDIKGNKVLSNDGMTIREVEDAIGKEFAQKFEDMPVDKQTILEGDGLKVGGSGMKGFYDKMIPDFLNKYVKKWNTKVDTVKIDVDDSIIEQPSVTITPEMKQSVMTEGQPMFSLKTDTPQFKKWFGDSKVVDDKGKPLVVYHGSQSEDEFNIFEDGLDNPQRARSSEGYSTSAGIYFTDDIYSAIDYSSGSTVYNTYVSIQNPLDLRTKDGSKVAEELIYYKRNKYDINGLFEDAEGSYQEGAIAKLFRNGFADFSESFYNDGYEYHAIMNAVVLEAKNNGYDGLIFKDGSREGQSNSYVVFSPNQIKSVNNTGEFDANNPDIMLSMKEGWTPKGIQEYINKQKSEKLKSESPKAPSKSVISDKKYRITLLDNNDSIFKASLESAFPQTIGLLDDESFKKEYNLNKDTVEKAYKNLEKDFDGVVEKLVSKPYEGFADPIESAELLGAIEILTRAGKIDVAIKLANRTSKKATLTAQSLQQLGAIGKYTPSRIIRKAQQIIENSVPEEKLETVKTKAKQVRSKMNKVNKQAIETDEFKSVISKMEDYLKNLKNKAKFSLKSDKISESLVREELKTQGITLYDLVTEHYSKANIIGVSLSKKISSQLGVSAKEAAYIEGQIIDAMERITTRKKTQIINSMITPKKYVKRGRKTIAEKIITLSNLGALDTDAYFETIAQRYGVPTLDEKTANRLVAQVDKMNKTNNVFDYAEEKYILESIISEKLGTTILEKLNAMMRLNMLTGPSNMAIKNPMGNTQMALLMRTVDALKSIPDYTQYNVRKALGGNPKRRYVFETGRGMSVVKDFLKDWTKGLTAGWKGIKLTDSSGQYEIYRSGKMFTNKLNPMYWVEGLVSGLLSSFDYAFYKSATMDKIYMVAKVRAINEGLKGDALDQAQEQYVNDLMNNYHTMTSELAYEFKKSTERGKIATFQNTTQMSTILQGIHDVLNLIGVGTTKRAWKTIRPFGEKSEFGIQIGPKQFGLGDVTVPFVRVLATLTQLGLEYSPLGYAKSLSILATQRSKISSNEDVKEYFLDSIAQASIGTFGLSLVGFYLAMQGAVTGADDEDQETRMMNQKNGIYSYSYNLDAIIRWTKSGFINKNALQRKNGDRFKSYSWMMPISLPIGIGANVQKQNSIDIKRDTINTIDAVLNSVIGIIDSIKDDSVASEILKIAGGKDKYAGSKSSIERTIESLPAMFVPTITNNIRKTYDNVIRNTSDEDGFKYAMNLVINKIPKQSKKLKSRLDISGEDQVYFDKVDSWMQILTIMFDPSPSRIFNSNRATEYLLKLNEDEGATNQFPRMLGNSLSKTIDGRSYTISLNPDQEKRMQQSYYKKAINAIDIEIGNGKLDKLGAEEKVESIMEILSDAGSEAREDMKIEIAGKTKNEQIEFFENNGERKSKIKE